MQQWPPGPSGQPQPGMQSPPMNMVGPGGGPYPLNQQGFMQGLNMGSNLPQANLLQSKVPNENLTPEQLQRREEQLGNLRKIQQMLFPDQQNSGMPGMMGPDKMGMEGPMPGNMNMMGSYTPGNLFIYLFIHSRLQKVT